MEYLKYFKNFINESENTDKPVLTKTTFRHLLNKKYDKLYLYPNMDFQGLNKDIKVECKKHGEFIINAGKHLKGEGCPLCKSSKTKADEQGYDRSTKNLTDSHYEKRPNYKIPNMIRRN